MRLLGDTKRVRRIRVAAMVIVGAIVLTACSGADDALDAPAGVAGGEDHQEMDFAPDAAEAEEVGAYRAVSQDGSVVFQSVAPSDLDARIIKDGRVELRLDLAIDASKVVGIDERRLDRGRRLGHVGHVLSGCYEHGCDAVRRVGAVVIGSRQKGTYVGDLHVDACAVDVDDRDSGGS